MRPGNAIFLSAIFFSENSTTDEMSRKGRGETPRTSFSLRRTANSAVQCWGLQPPVVVRTLMRTTENGAGVACCVYDPRGMTHRG